MGRASTAGRGCSARASEVAAEWPPARSRARWAGRALLLAAILLPIPSPAASLEEDLGRNDTRVLSAPVAVPAGRTVAELALDERLERLGYRRVHERPARPGEYFHGNDRYWIFRRPCRALGRDHQAELIGLALDRSSGRILGRFREGQPPAPLEGDDEAWLEPELLAESLAGDRAQRVLVELSEIPERVWRPVLAAEDARFFSHGGVDLRATARAAVRNILARRVVEGGSTITQQLIKSRDMSARRTIGRKASEALRARALEKEYGKQEILQAYLNTVYMGNVRGVAVHGLGTAARAYFSRRAEELSLAEAAALAAMIQGPNRLSPLDDADALRARRDWVLSRMEELGWATAAEVRQARAAAVIAARRRCGPAPRSTSWPGSRTRSRGRRRASPSRDAASWSRRPSIPTSRSSRSGPWNGASPTCAGSTRGCAGARFPPPWSRWTPAPGRCWPRSAATPTTRRPPSTASGRRNGSPARWSSRSSPWRRSTTAAAATR